MTTNTYDEIIFSIICGFIALPLYFGYIELTGREPSWLVNMVILVVSLILGGLIIYRFFNTKKSNKK